MALTPEQVKILKEQLKSQVHHLQEPQKAQALEQIESLSVGALETMLKQQQGQVKKEKGSKSIFRLIVDKEVPSVLVDENATSIAVLDINPISKGHILIIPRKEVKDAKSLPTQAFTLAKRLSNKIISKLKATTTEIQTENKFGETIINLIPIYGQSLSLNSPRQKAKNEELEEIASKLRTIKKPKIEKIKIENKQDSKSQVLKLPRKIP
jgi:histidine triad (HIT) family protein